MSEHDIEEVDSQRLAHIMWAQDNVGNRRSGKTFYAAFASVALAVVYERDTKMQVPNVEDSIRLRNAVNQARKVVELLGLEKVVSVHSQGRVLVQPYEARVLDPKADLNFTYQQLRLRKLYRMHGLPESAKNNEQLVNGLREMYGI